jgi:acetoacetyl-CoA synthetase
VPDEIVSVPAIPRTLNGKKLEIPVKKILAGAKPSDAAAPGTLAEPAALDVFIELGEKLARAPG